MMVTVGLMVLAEVVMNVVGFIKGRNFFEYSSTE
jgi:hypothetical protein